MLISSNEQGCLLCGQDDANMLLALWPAGDYSFLGRMRYDIVIMIDMQMWGAQAVCHHFPWNSSGETTRFCQQIEKNAADIWWVGADRRHHTFFHFTFHPLQQQ
jgi:hypothetical protein